MLSPRFVSVSFNYSRSVFINEVPWGVQMACICMNLNLIKRITTKHCSASVSTSWGHGATLLPKYSLFAVRWSWSRAYWRQKTCGQRSCISTRRHHQRYMVASGVAHRPRCLREETSVYTSPWRLSGKVKIPDRQQSNPHSSTLHPVAGSLHEMGLPGVFKFVFLIYRYSLRVVPLHIQPLLVYHWHLLLAPVCLFAYLFTAHTPMLSVIQAK